MPVGELKKPAGNCDLPEFPSTSDQALDLLIGKCVLPDPDVVDHAVHELTSARVSNLHGLAWAHQPGFALKRNGLLAIRIEIKPAFLSFIIHDERNQIPALGFEVSSLAIA